MGQQIIPFFDFKAEFALLKSAHQEIAFESINRMLLVQKTKTILVKKHGLAAGIELVVDWRAKEEERVNTEFLVKCREAGINEDDFINISKQLLASDDLVPGASKSEPMA